MKFRILTLGPGKLENRSFGVHYSKPLKVFYLRLYFFAFYAALGKMDPAADLERIRFQNRLTEAFLKNTNRKQRRTMEALARKQRHA